MAELIDKGHFTELAKLDPRDVCRRASCAFDETGNCYTLPIWNTAYRIYPDTDMVECADEAGALHEYFSLFAVQYLLTSRETTPTGEWISEKDMVGGVTFFRGPMQFPPT